MHHPVIFPSRMALLAILLASFSPVGAFGGELPPATLFLLQPDGPSCGVYRLAIDGTQPPLRLADAQGGAGLTILPPLASGGAERVFFLLPSEPRWQPYLDPVPRRVLTQARSTVFDPEILPGVIVHRFFHPSDAGPTGCGNHPQAILDQGFDGFDYPCSRLPAPVATMPGFFWVEPGRFYHSLDHPIWSPFTYGAGWGEFKGEPGVYPGLKHGWESPTRGGWGHRVIRERLAVKIQDWCLTEVAVPGQTPGVVRGGDRLARQVQAVWSVIEGRGECADGCQFATEGRYQSVSPLFCPALTAVEGDRFLLWSGDPGSESLSGLASDMVVIGLPLGPEAVRLGTCTRREGGQYVYAMSRSVLNGWLKEAGYPPDLQLQELSGLAVGHQEGGEGGTVFALDTRRGIVFDIRRDEPRQTINRIRSIPVPEAAGSWVAAVAADGQGGLLLVRWECWPAEEDLLPEQALSFDPLTGSGDDSLFMAVFRRWWGWQVYRLPVQGTTWERLPACLPCEEVRLSRCFWSDHPADRTSWIWAGPWQREPARNPPRRVEAAMPVGVSVAP